MLDQKSLIKQKEWDLLILLDACRYDSFKEIYRIEGELRKVKSPANRTDDWFESIFPHYYGDIVYVSANPLVFQSGEWKAEDHFFKTISVWDFGWRSVEGIETVPPEMVSKASRKALALCPEKRIFVHYNQPHEPYIGDVKLSKSYFITWRKIKKSRPFVLLRRALVRKITGNVSKNSGNEKSPALKELISRFDKSMDGVGSPPKSVADAVRRGMCDVEVLKEAYERNLDLVLKSIKNLLERVRRFRKSIVITSDHGELFRKPYGYRLRLSPEEYPEIFEVPFFKVK